MTKIKIGRVLGAQGLRGEIKIYHDSGDEDAIRRLTSLFFLAENGTETQYKIETLRMHKRTPVIKLEGVNDRAAAESLAGMTVISSLEESRPREAGIWLVSDLVGLEVRGVGKVVDIIDNPAHDILIIDTQNGEKMLPFVDAFVTEINPDEGFIIIDPPDGWDA